MSKTFKRIMALLLCIVAISIFSAPLIANAENINAVHHSNDETIKDETMLIIPIVTMLEQHGGLLFTTLLIGIVLGAIGTLVVQRFCRKREKK